MELETIISMAKRSMESVLAFIATEADFSAITKQKERDVTRRFDLVAEQKLQDELLSNGVNARVVSEEYGDRIVGDDPRCTLVFDPIDGSTNVAIGFPYFCSSLAYAPKIDDVSLSDITMGVVVTNSLDVFAATKGDGARLRGALLVKREENRYKPVVAAYAYGVSHIPRGLIAFEKKSIVRIFGSIAFDLCLVASGTLDAVIDTRDRLSGYDIAAAQLILLESNGIITSGNGHRLDAPVTASNLSLVCSTNRALHDRIVNMLQEFPSDT
ncbi:MAG TPA: inositol monophosphatase family protein [Candidatus Acidoferrales bacterium]|jgi:myo-inositol-1(or 4)-monophosphatase|nr:inositol monophosphatase family protein [Candidatus Acidoferrales bacterium]